MTDEKRRFDGQYATALFWLLIGFAFGILVGMWSPPDAFEAPKECKGLWFWCFLYAWQTLIAGSFALVGAFLLWKQVEVQRQQQEREAERRQIRARIQLPHALSQIHTYLQECYDCWKKKDFSDKPETPRDALAKVMDCAAEVDAESFESFQKLAQHAQPFDSRIDIVPEVRDVFYWHDRLIDLLVFWNLNENLYDYGRFRETTASHRPLTREGAYRILNVYYRYSDLPQDDPIKRRIEKALDHRFGKQS
ncbi:hypothetical protein [Labrenzia sp. CE80]|uniref:hypothetical protein n=1 Tax=Labrenzia sp. CE80 TaxID=1788986 RepID=UPI00129AAA40|nr:hypothetical protein [Labrenzia sp. CE80]